MNVTAVQLERLLEETPFTAGRGLRVISLEDGCCTLRVPFRPQMERPGGIVAGEFYMSAADLAFWCAMKTRLGLDDPSTTSHLDTAFLSPARTEDFDCSATVLRWGRRLVYGTAECRNLEGKLLTHHTLNYVRG
ncbi:MAG TPA: PaaI family thioesterase [Candidatus Dormibacteraeota bacterium]